MDLVKSGIRWHEGGQRGRCVSLDFRSLAVKARLCPLPDVHIDIGPDILSRVKS